MEMLLDRQANAMESAYPNVARQILRHRQKDAEFYRAALNALPQGLQMPEVWPLFYSFFEGPFQSDSCPETRRVISECVEFSITRWNEDSPESGLYLGLLVNILVGPLYDSDKPLDFVPHERDRIVAFLEGVAQEDSGRSQEVAKNYLDQLPRLGLYDGGTDEASP
jgi:hypothetical protein